MTAAALETQARTEAARALSVDVTQLTFRAERLDTAPASGVAAPMLLFRAEPRTGGRGRGVVGVASESSVTLDPAQAMRRVVQAWGYGARRTQPVTEVARVIGWLEGSIAETRPILTRQAIAGLKASWQQHVFLPRETVVGGQPAVEFWNSASLETPLWLCRVTFGPDGTALVTRTEIWDFEE